MRITVPRRAAAAGLAAVAATAATVIAVLPAVANDQPSSPSATTSDPIIFGHRGAAGYRPEHTAGSYQLAAQFGDDYLEPDLVPTKDGVLVDRHEPGIGATTDVANHPEFANRKRTVTIDGIATTDWFTFDFTYAELTSLYAIERLPDIRQHNTLYNGRFHVPTLQEDIDQVKALSAQYHRRIGIVPEIKHSTFFASIGLPMEARTLAVLRHNGLDQPHPAIPVVIQSFEVTNLKWLHQRVPNIPLLQLTAATGSPADYVARGINITYAQICSPAGLRDVTRYATFLGPDKNQIVPRSTTNHLLAPTSLVHDAHAVHLKVAPYTFRNENFFQPVEFQTTSNPADYGNAFAEYALFYGLGVDGLFSDNGDTAIEARSVWVDAGRPRKQ